MQCGCMPKYLLDTSAINRILDRDVPAELLIGRGICITHVQVDELLATRRNERREALLSTLERIESVRLPTSGAMFGLSQFNEAQWGDADGRLSSFLSSLNVCNRCKDNNARDSLIGATALANELVLVTEDLDQAKVCREMGGLALSLDELLGELTRGDA